MRIRYPSITETIIILRKKVESELSFDNVAVLLVKLISLEEHLLFFFRGIYPLILRLNNNISFSTCMYGSLLI